MSRQPRDLFLSELKGYRDGAAMRAMAPSSMDHERREITSAYESGYKAGQKDRREFSARLTAKYGWNPSILRTQELPQEPGAPGDTTNPTEQEVKLDV